MDIFLLLRTRCTHAHPNHGVHPRETRMILKDVSQETLVFPLLTIGNKLHMEQCISWDNGATQTWGITKLGST